MADRYWVGGSGNSNDTAHWSTSSGGAGGASVPTSSDNAIFDTASNTTAYTFTVNATFSCRDLNFSAAPSVSGTITWAGSSPVSVAGSMTLLTGMTINYTGGLTFNGTSGTQVVTSNGRTINPTSITFNHPGATVQLADNFSCGSVTITFTAGTFDPNGKTFTSTAVAGTLTLNTTGSPPTFANFTKLGASSSNAVFSLNGNLTASGTITITGGAQNAPLLVASSAVGTARTVTAATVSISNAHFRDITAAGAASPFTGTRLGDCGGNTSITTDSPRTVYWVGNSASFISNTSWSTSSGGASSANAIPLPQDTGIFDTNSFSANGQTVTCSNTTQMCAVDFSAVPETGITISNAGIEAYGDITLQSSMVVSGSGTTTMRKRGTQTLTSAGVAWTGNITIDAPGGTVSLADAFATASNRAATVTRGTLDTNGFSLTAGSVGTTGTDTKAIIIDGSTVTVTGTGSVWAIGSATGLTFSASGSEIIINDASSSTKTFAGAGQTYNNVTFTGAGTGTFAVSGSNTFNRFKCDTPPHTLSFTAGTTQTIADFQVRGTPGNLMTLQSATAANHNLALTGGGHVSSDYLSISRSQATPSTGTWFAGGHSTDGGNNSGWLFTDYVDPSSMMAMFP